MLSRKALDLCCKAGGAAKGLRRAGFYVVGVDIENQPHYAGDEFIQGNALDFKFSQTEEFVGGSVDAYPECCDRCGLDWDRHFDFVWASPPCQRYSDLAKRNGNADRWPDLIAPMREKLKKYGGSYTIENVEGAPLLDPVVLCGTMFPGLRVLRHRLFESNWKLIAPAHPAHPLVHTFDKRKSHFGRTDEWRDFVQVTGGGNCTLAAAKAAMGIDWMTKAEINEAIPPAYSEYIGRRVPNRQVLS